MDINKVNVKVDEFKSDYENIILEKENALAVRMTELESRVSQELEIVRGKVTSMIKAENEEAFKEKIDFYEKYFVEIVEPVVVATEESDSQIDMVVDTVVIDSII